MKVNPPVFIKPRTHVFTLALAAIAMLLSSFQGVKLVKAKLTEGIAAKLPQSFHEMQPEDIVQRFPSVRKPIAAYTSEDRLSDFSLKISATQWRESDIPMMKEFFKASIINLYDKVDFIQEDVVEVNGRAFAVFEFEGYVKGARKKYSYVQYTVANRQTLVFSFNTPGQQRNVWQPVAKAIMSSVKVK